MSKPSGISRAPAGLLVALVLLLSVLSLPASAGGAGPAVHDARRPGLARLLASFPGSGSATGIARFDEVPTAGDAASLRDLGLVVQPMKHLPLALVRGPVSAMVRAVASGVATDVYPEERIELHDQESSDAIMAAKVRARGLTGKGTTVGIVDSGCDGSHPDLADHLPHNVKLYSAEYVNIPPQSTYTIAVPIDEGPYQNTDLGSGHGTHVAGIVAADGTAEPTHLGVAPDAELVCFSIGEVLFTTAVVTAYDYLMDQPDLWGVDVINNSWGNSYRQFDPRDPVHTATKAVADLGVFVTFSAGNSGHGSGEMSVNPFSIAPWVSSTANMDVEFHRANSSSNGLVYDNSRAIAIGPGGHTTFDGQDQLGLYHPDLTAPGTDISSSCDSAGTVVGPCPPGENAEASGTSMASPHVAGAAAVLFQANPNLTPRQIRRALQATARPVMNYDTNELAEFWQIGYGRIDLERAVRLVQRKDYVRAIVRAQRAADRRILASMALKVVQTDFWTYDAPPVSVAGSDTREFTLEIPEEVTNLKVSIGHPSGATLTSNMMSWPVEVFDAAGRSLGTTTEFEEPGTGVLMLNLQDIKPPVEYGEFRFVASGELAVSDPDTFDSESLNGRVVILHVAQLVPNVHVDPIGVFGRRGRAA